MNTDFPADEQQPAHGESNTDTRHTLALRLAVELFEADTIVTTNDALLEALRNHVTMLLAQHPERLMSILYRIDVSEQRVNELMNHSPVGAIATHIASLILERMHEKVLTRERYRQQSQDEDETDDASE